MLGSTHSCSKVLLVSDVLERRGRFSCKGLVSKNFSSLRINWFLIYNIFNFGPSRFRGSCSGQELGGGGGWARGWSRKCLTVGGNKTILRSFNSEINCDSVTRNYHCESHGYDLSGSDAYFLSPRLKCNVISATKGLHSDDKGLVA